MKNDDTYLTITDVSQGLYKEKGSKFISLAHPIRSENEAKDLLNHYKNKHNKARHHCYAYKIGVHHVHYRLNDDGEPTGSAGKPIYGQILSHNLTNILVLVIRYFGGTLLGTGGLITAYKNAAFDALNNAHIAKQTLNTIYAIHYPYEDTNEITRLIKQFDGQTLESNFTSVCEQKIAIRQSLADAFYYKIHTLDDVKIEVETND